jgi:predicted metal-dependent enzyme (double-stranded beta helix superfamily)
MVGKTPQVREIVYNVLDDSGERTVIAKGATTVDVGDTKELFTRTTDLELVTSNTFSNVANVQSNIISIETYLSQFSGSVYSPLLVTLQRDHADNAERIEVLEEVHLSNSLIVSNNFSNITILQEIVDSNVGRIDGIVADQLSNAIILVSGTFSNVSQLYRETMPELLSNMFGEYERLWQPSSVLLVQEWCRTSATIHCHGFK